MLLKELKAENFKNYEQVKLHFTEGINCFVGKNGAGKTNLLDAAYVLCSGKSYFNLTDQQLIHEEENFFSLKGEFQRLQENETVLCALMRGRKKVIKRNDVQYEKMLQHYGEFPAVIVTPGDINLIIGGSEDRRRWLDSTLSLKDRDYLIKLLKYEKLLQQRNAELKNLAKSEKINYQLLEVYDAMLVPLAEDIYNKRKEFIDDFLPYFSDFHHELSQGNEVVELQYRSNLQNAGLHKMLKDNYKKDIYLQRTSCGVHKDELLFLLGENLLRKFGSQGQQKTYLLSLKMAQHQYIKIQKGFAPLLLLDDVCERLDEQRLNKLFQLIQQPQFGQVFITDTSKLRLKGLLKEAMVPVKYFEVVKGVVQ